jgi:hypothetical protein
MRISLMAVIVSLLTLTCVLCARAQENEKQPTSAARLDGASRYVGLFDFEEAAQTTQPVPPHWLRVLHDPPARDLPEFPPWNESRYDDTFASSGAYSMMLPASGGSTRLRLSGGVIPALPDADYAMRVAVRTQGAVYSRARVAMRFLDESLVPIEGARAISKPIISEHEWTHVQLELAGRDTGAAWIQLDLELLQPDQLPSIARDPAHIPMEDFHARAWFDDVQVRQLPRIVLHTNAPGNVIFAPDAPTLTATVRDLTGESLNATISILDIDNNVLDEFQFQGVSRGEGIEWAPNLPRYGWYRAELHIESNDRTIATTILPLVWAPDTGRDEIQAPSRFGVSIENISAGQFGSINTLIRALGVGVVHLPVWDADAQLSEHDAFLNDLDESVDELLDAAKRITLTMPGMPAELAAATRIDAELPLLLTDAPAERWMGYLDPILTRFGQRVTRWQPGRSQLDRYNETDGLGTYVDTLHTILANLSPEPSIVLPWQGVDATHDSIDHADYALYLPEWVSPESVTSWIERAETLQSSVDTIVLANASNTTTTPRSRVADIVKRATLSSRGGEHVTLLEQPWDWNKNEPILGPEFAAWRTVVQELSDRTIVGHLPMPEGAYAAILSGPGGGAIVAWNEWADPELAVIDKYLGQGTLTIKDVFGNQMSAHPDAEGNHNIPLHSMPIIITGIDTNISLFRSQFTVEPPFIVSLAARHDLEIVLNNPWPLVISGTLRLQSPLEWDMTPRTQSFIIEPHGTRTLPIAATIGVGGEAGIHDVVAQIELQADTQHPVFELSTQVEVGLEHVQLTATARRSANANAGIDDVIVTLLIRNTSENPVTMNAFTIAPSFPRQQAPVSNIPPGASNASVSVSRPSTVRYASTSRSCSTDSPSSVPSISPTRRIATVLTTPGLPIGLPASATYISPRCAQPLSSSIFSIRPANSDRCFGGCDSSIGTTPYKRLMRRAAFTSDVNAMIGIRNPDRLR